MRKALAVGIAALSTAGMAALVPTAAQAGIGTGDTAVTATVGISGLGTVSIVTGVAAAFAGGTNATVSSPTIVTDTRTAAPGSWNLNVSSTDLSLVGATTPVTIPASDLTVYTSAPVVTIPGTAVVTDGHADSSHALTLANSPALLLSAATTNANIVTFTPTLTLTVPGGQADGLYTGTLTQTAS